MAYYCAYKDCEEIKRTFSKKSFFQLYVFLNNVETRKHQAKDSNPISFNFFLYQNKWIEHLMKTAQQPSG